MIEDEIPREVKILHIHRASDEHENFIEFVIIESGKTHILRESSFIQRYGSIEEAYTEGECST